MMDSQMSFCQTKTDAVNEEKPIDEFDQIAQEYDKSLKDEKSESESDETQKAIIEASSRQMVLQTNEPLSTMSLLKDLGLKSKVDGFKPAGRDFFLR